MATFFNKDSIGTYIFYLIILVLLLLFLLKDCGVGNIDEEYKTTTFVKTTADTTYFPKDTIRVNVAVTKYKFIHDTIWGIKDSIKLYSSPFEDSMLSGNISSKVYGLLLSSELKYVPKFPKYIHTTDSIFTTAYIPVGNKTRGGISVGLQVNGNVGKFGFGPMMGYTDNKGASMGYGYDVLNKNHYLFFTKRITLK